MKKWLLIFPTIMFMVLFQVWGQSNINKEETILTINETKVPVAEFLYLYAKNYEKAPAAYRIESLEEYFQLFVNFKLKVFEAKQQGLHKKEAFIKEFTEYRNQLAAPYLTDGRITEQILQEAHARLLTEVSASHILIRTNTSGASQDTLTAYNKIMEIKEKALAGEDFGDLAYQYSEDPSAKKNKGALGYFSALQMVYPFENAAYNTPVNEISHPVKTRFGYHLVKVTDKRPSKGEVSVAHILVRVKAGNEEITEKKIQEIYKKVMAGEKWEQLCEQFSEDLGSKNKGGVLRPITSSMMLPSFTEAAFALEKPGDIAQPIKTDYGWHIIKLIEKKLPGSFEEMRSEIERKVKRDARNNVPQKVFIAKLKKDLDFQQNEAAQGTIDNAIENNLLEAKFEKPQDASINQQILFTINDTFQVKVGQFFDYVLANQRPQQGKTLTTYLSQLLESFTEQQVLTYEDAHLVDKYPEFKQVQQEYYDGLLLFEVMENEVWNKAVEDSTGLKQFFNQNRGNYTWGKRANTLTFDASSEKLLEQATKMYSKGIFPAESKQAIIAMSHNSLQWGDTILQKVDSLVSLLKEDTSLYVKISTGFVKKEDKNLGALRAQKLLAYLYAKKIDSARVLATYEVKQKPFQKGLKGGQMKFDFFTKDAIQIAAFFNKTEPLALQVTEKQFEQESDTLPQSVLWKEGSYSYKKNDRFYKVFVKEVLDGTQKELNQTRGQVISDYQNYLETKWLDGLKRQYNVISNTGLLEKIAKSKSRK